MVKNFWGGVVLLQLAIGAALALVVHFGFGPLVRADQPWQEYFAVLGLVSAAVAGWVFGWPAVRTRAPKAIPRWGAAYLWIFVLLLTSGFAVNGACIASAAYQDSQRDRHDEYVGIVYIFGGLQMIFFGGLAWLMSRGLVKSPPGDE